MKIILKFIKHFCVFVWIFILVAVSDSFCFYVKNSLRNVEVFAKENSMGESSYAKVLSGCVLYKTQEMVDDIYNIYFLVPETYFVLILDDVGENCYKVKYDRFVGFVNKSSVEIALFVPIVKTLDNVTFDIKASSGTQIWKNPSTNSEIFTTLAADTKNLSYIASVVGEVPSGGKSNIWFYVSYTSSINSTNVYEGYVYSENTTNLSDIVLNIESNPEVLLDENNNEKLFFISSTIKTIIVAVIAIPIILFFVIILYKLIKKFKKNTNSNKNFKKSECDDIDGFVKNQNRKSIEKYKNMTLLKNENNSPQLFDYDDEDLL